MSSEVIYTCDRCGKEVVGFITVEMRFFTADDEKFEEGLKAHICNACLNDETYGSHIQFMKDAMKSMRCDCGKLLTPDVCSGYCDNDE